MKLCLSMIVKNEARIIERCLASVKPWISSFAVLDTGSTDDTIERIQSMLGDLPGIVATKDFVDFSTTRNEALDLARSQDDADYLLLIDADMELRCAEPVALSAPAYRCVQKQGNLSYRNTRLLRRDAPAHYVGVTHEYLAVEGIEDLDSIWFLDHADGANRPDKFARDIELLEADLKRDPNNARSVYYLARSYQDFGAYQHAATLYRRRAEMGGWAEEVWSSKLNEARCRRAAGESFVVPALSAYSLRPSRAEPLYDLAKFDREKGNNRASLLWSERGLEIPKPNDWLFVEDNVYDWGLREEFAICAYYDPVRRDRGRQICDALALDRSVPVETRDTARRNLHWYSREIGDLIPSWWTKRLTFEPPSGYFQMNPSVTRLGNRLMIAERTINYWITRRGYNTPPNHPINSRTFLLSLDPDSFEDEPICEILPPVDFPAPVWKDVLGWEDMRLFEWQGDLWVVSTVREQSREGFAEQWLGKISGAGNLSDARVMHPVGLPRVHEKNWMPLIKDDDLMFVYTSDPTRLITSEGTSICVIEPKIAADHFRGSSQVIQFLGGWLAVVHSTVFIDNWPKYHHRFVWYDLDFRLRRVSEAWRFPSSAEPDILRGYQYVMGLCWHPDGERLVMSYQLDERESWIGTMAAYHVWPLLNRSPGGGR